MIDNKSYIHIGGWMINELELKGNDLLVYAIIYSFTNGTKDHYFNGSLGYLAERTNSTERGIQKNLKSLIEKGYIEKEETGLHNTKVVKYRTKFQGVEQSSITKEQSSITKEQSSITKEQSSITKEQSSTNIQDIYTSNIQEKEIGDNKLSHKESEDAFKNLWEAIPTAKGGNEKEGRKMYEQKIQNGMSGEMMYKLALLSKFEIREKVKGIMYSQKKENWIRDVCPQTDDEMEARIVDILKARYKRIEEGIKFKVNTVQELCDMFGQEYIGKLWKAVQVEAKKRFNL